MSGSTNRQFDNDTQCWLFGCNQYNSDGMRKRDSTGLVGAPRTQPTTKHSKIIRQQQRPNSKNSKHESSQQKGKISLSKMAPRKNSQNNEDSGQKVEVYNYGQSKISKPMSNTSQLIGHNNASFSFNQRHQIPEGQTFISFNNSSNFVADQQHNKLFDNLHTVSFGEYQDSHKIYQTPLVGSNLHCSFQYPKPPLPKQKNITFQYSNSNHLSLPSALNSQLKRPLSVRGQKPLPQPYQLPETHIISSQHEKTHLSNNSNHQLIDYSSSLKIKGGPTITPTQETDRILITSRLKQSKAQQRERFSIQNSLHKNFNQSQYDHRLTQTLEPGFCKQRLNTVQSFYGSDVGNKREVQESVILIDFFNPAQNVREQLQQKLRNKKFQPFL